MTSLLRMGLLAALFSFLAVASSVAADLQAQERTCLRNAEDLPDMAVAQAEVWFKHGGGSAALVCRATAEFHTGEYVKSAEDFTSAAAAQKNSREAAILHQQAGLSWTRAQNFDKSEDEYGKALKFEAQDPELWLARANERATAQHYWDAINDLNMALGIMPDMPEALKLRGQVWYKLGLARNAEVDFRHVAEIQAEEDVANSKLRTQATKQNP